MQRRQNIITWHVTAWHLTCRHWSVTRQRVSDSKLSFDGWHGDAGHYRQWVSDSKLSFDAWHRVAGHYCVTRGRWALSHQRVRDKLSTDAWHGDAGHYHVNGFKDNYHLMCDTGTLGINASTCQWHNISNWRVSHRNIFRGDDKLYSTSTL